VAIEESPTKYVVLGVMGLALTAVIFSVMEWRWGLLTLGLLIYETWTLVNRYPGDTISEIIWALSVKPLVPWLFGIGTGWAISSGFVENHYLIAGLLFLQGHFFFQRDARPECQ
jgi:hypothetical protein